MHVDEDEVAEVTTATSIGEPDVLEEPTMQFSVEEIIQQIAEVSARAREAGLNVSLSVVDRP